MKSFPNAKLSSRLLLGLMLAVCALSGCNTASSGTSESSSAPSAETSVSKSAEVSEAETSSEVEQGDSELPTIVTMWEDVSADPNDLSRPVDLSKVTNLDDPLLQTLTFSTRTIFPEDWQEKASTLLERCKDPGLGVRQLHEAGIKKGSASRLSTSRCTRTTRSLTAKL